MDFTLTEEQSLLCDTARAYFAKSVPSPRARLWSDIAGMGWLSVMVPEEQGGFGGTIVDGCLLARELGRGNVVLPFAETAILGPTAFAQDEEMLGRIAAGEVRIACALAWDAPPSFVLEGEVLRGARAFLPADPAADVLLAEAAVPEGATVLAAIPLTASGVSIARHTSLDGLGGLSVTLDGCVADGHILADTILPQLRLVEPLARAAEAIGLMDYLLTLTRDYALTRQQFGQPIAGFQVIRHRLVEMHGYWQLAESLLFQASDTLRRTGPVPEAQQAVRAAFSHTGRQARRIGKEAIQLHGAIGTMAAYPAGHAFARIVALTQACGGMAFHERQYAEAMMPLGDTSRLWAL